jgi:DNA-binding transcriptional ArsR family regulator
MYNQMVVETLSDTEVDRIFQALADATRRDILARVVRREQSVTELARQYSMSFAAVQKHVAVLATAMLISKHRRGREQIVHAEIPMVRRAAKLLDAYEDLWRARVQQIDQILAEETEE